MASAGHLRPVHHPEHHIPHGHSEESRIQIARTIGCQSLSDDIRLLDVLLLLFDEQSISSDYLLLVEHQFS